MITLEQLDILNKYGIGPSIDELEVFVMYFKQALSVSELDSYIMEYEELRGILKELRPESLVFDEVTELKKLKWDKFDIVKAESAIKKINGNAMVAVAKEIGVKVKLSYSSGVFYRAYVSSDNNRYFDVTNILRGSIKENVKYLEEYDNCELICKVFTRGCKRDVNNCIEVFKKLMNNIEDKYVVEIFDIRGIKDNRINVMLKLKEAGFNMAKTKVIRNIDMEDIDKMLNEINIEFKGNNGFYMMTDDFNDGKLMKCDVNSFREDIKSDVCERVYSVLEDGEFKYRLETKGNKDVEIFRNKEYLGLKTDTVIDRSIKPGESVKIMVANNEIIVEEQ